MKKHLLVLILSLILCSPMFAQKVALCGSDKVNQELMEQNPVFKQKLDEFEKRWKEYNASGKRNILGSDTTYEIPVVMHIIHTGGAIGTNYNPADTQLTNWVNYVNQVFAAQYPSYPDTSSGGTYFPYKFVLAKRDPNCNATTGIVRVNGSSLAGYTTYGLQYNTTNGATQADIRGLSHWPEDSYYNIYVINKIDSIDPYLPFPGTSYIAGFAYYPGAGISDAAYMLAYTARSGQTTMPHEMGHAMGLRHTFEGGSASVCPPNVDCTTDGDKVCDTEPVKNLLSVFPCVTNAATNSCTGALYNNGQKNIMGYGSCLDRFTPGQKNRALLQLLTMRAGLASSVTTLPPGVPVTGASCVPTILNPGNAFGIGPCNVTLNTLAYTSGGYSTSVYTDHSCQLQTVLNPTTSYTLSVTTQTNVQKVRAYIDYNNNGIFTASELVLDHSGTTNNETHTAIFTPAAGAVLDTPLRMRVIADFIGSPTPTSCSALDYGEAEDFGVFISTSNPLPVKLLSFTAQPQAKDRTIQLIWQTVTEVSLNRFDVERSTDGENFSPITTQKALGSQAIYAFTDKDVMAEQVYYYRLKSIDNDGKFSYSKVVTAKLSSALQAKLRLYPNPVTGSELTYAFDAATAATELRITDITGKVLLKKAVKDTQGTIDISKLQSDVYMLQLCSGDKVIEVQKVWIQK